MESKDVSTTSHDEAGTTAPFNKIRDFIEENSESLTRTLRAYVSRAGLARGEQVLDTALEVLQDTIVEALKSASNFDVSRQPKAWLLGIAANIIKRRQVTQAIKHKYEVAVADATPYFGNNSGSEPNARINDAELFDRIASLTVKHGITKIHTKHRDVSIAQPSGEEDFIANEQAEAMLARCSPEDQIVLRLAVLHGLDGKALAKALGVKPGTARVRLLRALKRLQKTLI
jgi:RNA polymerase sigma-70 factor (ECF subfamily)